MAVNMDTIEKLPLPQKALIVGGVIIVIYIAFYFLYVTGKNQEIDKKTTELGKITYEVSQGKAVAAKIAEYEAKKKELELQLKEAEKRLPREPKIAEVLEVLGNYTRGNKILMTKFAPGKINPGCGGICREIELDVKLTGTFNDIAIFLDQLSKIERIIGVRTINFTAEKKKSSKKDAREEDTMEGIDLKADAKMITYMFAGAGDAAAAGKPKPGAKKPAAAPKKAD